MEVHKDMCLKKMIDSYYINSKQLYIKMYIFANHIRFYSSSSLCLQLS